MKHAFTMTLIATLTLMSSMASNGTMEQYRTVTRSRENTVEPRMSPRCTDADRIRFFRLLQTNTDYYQFSMDELTDIWDETPETVDGGGRKWSDLKNTVSVMWGLDSSQYEAFDELGPLVGVNY